jgi:hypothetical protein
VVGILSAASAVKSPKAFVGIRSAPDMPEIAVEVPVSARVLEAETADGSVFTSQVPCGGNIPKGVPVARFWSSVNGSPTVASKRDDAME